MNDRVLLGIACSIIYLSIPSIVGKIIRNSYPDIDSSNRYRTAMINPAGAIMGLAFWIVGTSTFDIAFRYNRFKSG